MYKFFLLWKLPRSWAFEICVMQLPLLNSHYIVFAPPFSACEKTALCDSEKRSSLLFLERLLPLVKRWSGRPAGAAEEEQKKTREIHFHPSLDPKAAADSVSCCWKAEWVLAAWLSWTALLCSRPVLSGPQLLVRLSSSALHVCVQSECRTARTRRDVERFVSARQAIWLDLFQSNFLVKGRWRLSGVCINSRFLLEVFPWYCCTLPSQRPTLFYH